MIQACKIISNDELSAGYFRMVLEKPFESFTPGQFCMVQIPGNSEILVRRPFSLCLESQNHFHIVYKAVGPVTRAMSLARSGHELNIQAPLGKGLDWSGYSRVIGIAGGYGIAPMLGLGQHLKTAKIAYEVYYGTRSQADILLQADFAAAAIPLHISTEDGSSGYKGYVTELLEQQLTSGDKTLFFVCGPHGLLQAAAQLAQRLGYDCAVSMEEYMGCGIGVCLGCVVKTKQGNYVRSCIEGPVMDAKDVEWEGHR